MSLSRPDATEGAPGLWERQAAPTLQQSSGADTRMLHVSPHVAHTAWHTQRRHPCRAPGWAMPGPTAEFTVSLPAGVTDTAPGISGQGPGLGAGSKAQGATEPKGPGGGGREPAESSPRNPRGASAHKPGAHTSARAARRSGAVSGMVGGSWSRARLCFNNARRHPAGK